jgi:hypothetical protein
MQMRKWICIMPMIIACSVCLAQKTVSRAGAVIFTADSVATGNYKDILTSFFQLAFNNLTGPRKEFRFTSNPFAVMARMNPDLMIDTSYVRYKNLRKLNFAFALNVDTSFRFNGYSSSLSYALINQRDITVSTEFVRLAYEGNSEFNRMNDSLQAFIARLGVESEERRRIRAVMTAVFRDSSTVRFNQLSPRDQQLMKDLATLVGAKNFLELVERDPYVVIRNGSQKSFNDLKQLFQNKILWTVGVNDTTYKNQFAFSNIVFYTSFLKGVIHPQHNVNVELDIRSFYNLLDDPFVAGRDLKRQVFIFEPGVNLVLKSKATHQSFFEFSFRGSYNRIFNGLYAGEEADVLMFKGMLRVRVFADIWVPLEFRYDPKNGNLFGFLNVRANFNGFKKLL